MKEAPDAKLYNKKRWSGWRSKTAKHEAMKMRPGLGGIRYTMNVLYLILFLTGSIVSAQEVSNNSPAANGVIKPAAQRSIGNPSAVTSLDAVGSTHLKEDSAREKGAESNTTQGILDPTLRLAIPSPDRTCPRAQMASPPLNPAPPTNGSSNSVSISGRPAYMAPRESATAPQRLMRVSQTYFVHWIFPLHGSD